MTATQAAQASDIRLWSLSRIDIRSPVMAGAAPTARVELDHPVRGRVTEIGSAPGAFDAVFVAASHILDVQPRLLGYNVRSAGTDDEGALVITIEISLEHQGRTATGASTGVDLVRASLAAWLDALAQCAEAEAA